MSTDPIKDFNKIIMALMTELEQQHKSDGDVFILKNRIKMAKNTERDVLVLTCGPLLYKYKDYIKNDEFSKFLDKNNLPELNENNLQKEDRSMVNHLFSLITDTYVSYPEDKQIELRKKVKGLLVAYVDCKLQKLI